MVKFEVLRERAEGLYPAREGCKIPIKVVFEGEKIGDGQFLESELESIRNGKPYRKIVFEYDENEDEPDYLRDKNFNGIVWFYFDDGESDKLKELLREFFEDFKSAVKEVHSYEMQAEIAKKDKEQRIDEIKRMDFSDLS